ncbi:3-oxoacyl-ACP reductase FabG [Convivina praedatoris]|uniref:3-oxoacyl-[acyl-carrier-protein] reductase FabG n=1 Tax=Convivina praedatoris TaxID=2880963 RepID=A0ABM9D2Q9_9LACO|nr:3-oxoacyl-ACP reductase FabG [Convivina sp. LMG 32447]CAH1851774.1 3-oxoacyl-[acyl-carrier-protein] reductase FabG [Convivina sp. LMG 32447]CAH1851800.1 3-oxoacyl-[acyl-carrier-protein] reductase FabG [Convivina sp. LMG 32447]CAH1853066.1 3-oxoacyl-[acyl-carrier-protein] reductase FabG [Convivina sp. LMG 32447]
MNFTDKTVLVTGSSRGIGLAIAHAFDKLGARLILHARSAIKPEVIASFHQEPLTLQFDIADAKAAEEALKALYKQDDFEGIDILVNNAGITKDQITIGMLPADFAQVVNVNLNGTFNVTQPIFKKMIRQKHGSIINISSVVGQMGNVGQVNYSAAKAGLIGMTKTLAKEGARRQIQVNAIAPGMIVSDMTDQLSDKARKSLLESIPLSRFGSAEDVADVAVFLAGNNYITGQTITVDGGLHI